MLPTELKTKVTSLKIESTEQRSAETLILRQLYATSRKTDQQCSIVESEEYGNCRTKQSWSTGLLPNFDFSIKCERTEPIRQTHFMNHD